MTERNIMEQMDKISKLQEETEQLMQDLHESLTIKRLWPDAFDHGAVLSQVSGHPAEQLTFTVTLGNEEQRSLPLEEVPVILWSDQVKQDIRKRGSRKYRNLLQGESNGTSDT